MFPKLQSKQTVLFLSIIRTNTYKSFFLENNLFQNSI
jgi:hypothetical protein